MGQRGQVSSRPGSVCGTSPPFKTVGLEGFDEGFDPVAQRLKKSENLSVCQFSRDTLWHHLTPRRHRLAAFCEAQTHLKLASLASVAAHPRYNDCPLALFGAASDDRSRNQG